MLNKRDQMAQDITFVKARINHQEHFPLCPPTIVLLAPVVEPEDSLTLLTNFLYFHLLLLIRLQRLNYLQHFLFYGDIIWGCHHICDHSPRIL